jgi:squalene-associated FAD-dependent desaturase
VVGAGLAGLSAAVTLRQAGLGVAISDSAARAGGRCRSYFDPALGLTIDNGNHLVLAGNPAVARFRQAVGAATPLAGPDHAEFAFADLATGERWRVRLNDGPLPWWVMAKSRRVPGTSAADYLPLAKLLTARPGQVIGDLVRADGPVWQRLLHPVLLAVLNTDPATATATLAANVLKETLAKGGKASAPRVAAPDLASAFIDPAVGWLAARGVPLATGRRLKALEFADDRVAALVWADGRQPVAPDEAVVLAVPAWVAGELVPGLSVPTEHRAILNAHFACAVPLGAPAMLGLLGATSEWIFTHPGRISVTISAADRLIDAPREELATLIWGEVAAALGLAGAPMPPWQIVKEKRATFAATPAQEALRPPARTRWTNLFLAGDWVANGLPATIEGALRSGDTAARLALGQPLRYRTPRC